MPLIHCPECQKEVSTEARACPQCAFPNPGGKAKDNGWSATSLIPCPDCRGNVSKHAAQCPHCGCPLSPVSESAKKESTAHSFQPEQEGKGLICPHCGMAYDQPLASPSSFPEPASSASNRKDEALPSQSLVSPIHNSQLDPAFSLKETSKESLKMESAPPQSVPSSASVGLKEEKRPMPWEESGFDFSELKGTSDIPGPQKIPSDPAGIREPRPMKGRERKLNPLWEEMTPDEEVPSYSRSPNKWAISAVILVALILVFAASVAIWKLAGLEQF